MRYLLLFLISCPAWAAQHNGKLLDFVKVPATLEFDNGLLLFGKAEFKLKRKVIFVDEKAKMTMLVIRGDCIKPGTDADVGGCWPRLKVDIEVDNKVTSKSAILRIREDGM